MVTFPGSKKQKNKLINELLIDHDRFHSVIGKWLNHEADDRYGWAVSGVIEAQPNWALPYVKTMVKRLEEPQTDAMKRNITRALQFVTIPETHQGRVLEICYRFLCSEHEKVACRVFSMSIIHNISKNYPDLQAEFINTLTDLYPYGSAGFKSRAKKIIKDLTN